MTVNNINRRARPDMTQTRIGGDSLKARGFTSTSEEGLVRGRQVVNEETGQSRRILAQANEDSFEIVRSRRDEENGRAQRGRAGESGDIYVRGRRQGQIPST